jgi:DNA-binding NarL/FixJ family response regulator
VSDDTRIRVLLADDHPLIRMGLRSVLDASPDVIVVAEAENGTMALEQIQALVPDVAVLDLEMPGQDGIAVALAIQQARLPVKPVLLTAHRNPGLVNRALDSGLRGYVLKDAAVTEILDCVRHVQAGHHYISPQLSTLLVSRRNRATELAAITPGLEALTPTERDVLARVAQGQTSREIGELMFISHRTVEHHRANIAEKLNLRGANALMRFAIAHRSELS